MTRDQIKEVFLQHGFKVREGFTDLKPYVYEAAEALLAAERERCAKMCDAYAVAGVGKEMADAIRRME